MKHIAILALGLAVVLSACGGGSSKVVSKPNDDDDPPSVGTDPLEEINERVLSDAIFDLDDRRVRMTEWECREDLSFICTARLGQLEAYADPRGEFTYEVLGEWEHLYVAGVHYDDGVLFAATAGVRHPEASLPSGSAMWTGNMVGVHRPPETPMDEPGQVVRGGAEITLVDFQDPAIDVVLSPESLDVMEWRDIPVKDGTFSQEGATTTDAPWPGPPNRAAYIQGVFYGPNAEEVGGVFEDAGIVGAFAAGR